MEPVNVVVTGPIGEELLKKIRKVSPRVKLINASELFQPDRDGDPAAKKKMDAILAQAEVLYAPRLPKDAIKRTPKLKWVQVMSAGVDRFLADEDLMKSPSVLTNVSGIHATPIAEWVLGTMLMFAKKMPVCFQLKQECKWERNTPSNLRGKTVGIVGLGNIGKEVARLSKAFGMKVVATRRSAKKIGKARCVDTVYPASQLDKLLKESDYVVMTLAYTPDTAKIIGEKELKAMKPTAYLLNIARGGVIDEEALIRALKREQIAGAGLDVFSAEPLPEDSKLWKLPNVIMSPHISGGMEDYDVRATGVFIENLKRYVNGKRMLTVVNKKLGY